MCARPQVYRRILCVFSSFVDEAVAAAAAVWPAMRAFIKLKKIHADMAKDPERWHEIIQLRGVLFSELFSKEHLSKTVKRRV